MPILSSDCLLKLVKKFFLVDSIIANALHDSLKGNIFRNGAHANNHADVHGRTLEAKRATVTHERV